MVAFDTINPIHALPIYHKFTLMLTNFTLCHRAMQTLLSDANEHFDVVVVEVVLTDAVLGLGQHFGAPVVGFSPLWTWDVASLVGTPVIMSYIPNALLSFTDQMSFGQRIDNALVTIFEGATGLFYRPRQEEIYEQVFKRANKPSYQEVLTGVSLVLLNQHYSTNVPRPNMPNMIEVGGLHIDEPKSLPDDVRAFVEGAEYGVIYVSLGAYVRSAKLPLSLRQDILHTFHGLKERVLWRWDDPDMRGKPSNVMIRKSFPQNDILAHSKVKLFVTHGGALSISEAVYHGRPIVGIPFLGYQMLNVKRAVNQGLGQSITYDQLTGDSLTRVIHEVLNNPSYAERANELSITYRDQPVKPMRLAKYWVEYVARHKGAPHMQSAGQRLSFIQYYSVDVFAVVLGSVVMWLYLIWIALFWLCQRFMGFGWVTCA